jgi:glucose/arabinose dehydrogenase
MALRLKPILHAALLPTMAVSLVSAQAAVARTVAGATAISTITLPDGSQHTLQTPADLRVSVYATGLPNARFMALGPRGDVFVGSWYAGTVSVLLNRKGGARATQVQTLLSGLTIPHGVAFHNGLLYVAEEGRVTSWSYNASSVRAANSRVVIPSLPTGGRHVTRTVSFGPDGSIYVSVGSSCNECVDYTTRAVIMHYRSNGTGGQIFARGLRNSVGLAWQPGTSRLWAVDNGEDSLGDNIPPDELNLIRQGANYGWPYCWGNGQQDPTIASAAGYCAQTTNPVVSLQAHSAPLGLTFYSAKQLPARYRGGVFVAYHGSAYRSQATGYKVVYIPVNGTHAGAPQDVVTGWLPATGGGVWGRPVGLLVAADGSLLISDDQAGVIYRLSAAR